MEEFDGRFIQAIKHRPKLTITEAEGIPLIDLSVPNTQLLVTQIGDACKNWGFFQVINQGVPLELRENAKLAAKKFFAQPKEEKLKVKRNAMNLFGYYDVEHPKNVKDWKELFGFTIEDAMVIPSSDPDDKELKHFINQWPENPKDLRELCEEYGREVEKLCYKLMGLVALSLGFKEDRFHKYFKDSTSSVRLKYYPRCPFPNLALGVGRHKDSGALTVLYQDEVGGLEVKRKSDGEWIRIKPIPNAYIINVGDTTQVWSNDKYESVEHRATVNSEKERFSIPYFFNPTHSIMVEPVQELIDDENPAKYKAYNFGRFLASLSFSNFKKLDVENIQIHHFKAST